MLREWYFQAMGQELGPLSAGELKAKVTNGQVQPDTLVRRGPEGKWIFGANVKGLFATVEPPPRPIAPAPAKPKTSTTIPIAGAKKPGSSAEIATRSGAKPGSSTTIPIHFVTLNEDDAGAHVPTMEFYDFVGFREAISPVLHDAMRQFATKCSITMGQLNRRAVANFIQRPELASDLMITAVAATPQPVNEKSNQDGSQPLSEREAMEIATFRFTLFNSSHHSIDVGECVFLPKTVEERSYDTIAEGQQPILEHAGHLPLRLDPLEADKAIRMPLDVTIPAQGSRDIVIWFHKDPKPSLLNVRGQILLGHGNESAMSEFFTITLHGDSPGPDA